MQPGDVVKLKSGGPSMTVQYLEENERTGVRTTWFSGLTPYNGNFAAAALVQVDVEQLEKDAGDADTGFE